MCTAECIVDIDIAKARKLLGKGRIVRFLTLVEAQILE